MREEDLDRSKDIIKEKDRYVLVLNVLEKP